MAYWSDKVVVVTGGSQGLGFEIAKAFAAAGSRLVLAALPDSPLENSADELRASGTEVVAVATDITQQPQVDSLAETALARFGRVDVLVNCAGRSARGAVLDTSPKMFQTLWELNFLAMVRCTRALGPALIESQGHIVNIGSLAAKSAARYLGAYPASKFPVAAYSHQLRLELRPQGVHVLLVCPGPLARADAGQRYDKIVSFYLSDCSRSFAAALIQDGHITIENKKKKPGYRVKPGEKIQCRIPEYEPPSLQPEAIPLNILFEDKHIIVVDKPAGLVVHPAPGNDTGTLVNALLHHCPELGGINAELRPGIVHRLDKDTTGAMVVAKSRFVLENLSQQFKKRQVQKTYLALVHGVLDRESGTVSLPIGRHPVDRKKMSTVGSRGREAETTWRVKARYADATLLELDLKTGRTHQIRVHCASMHHPIIGDAVYTYGKHAKKKQINKPLEALLTSAKRQMLHAMHLSFTHPVEKRSMSFTAPIPDDMQILMDGLSQYTE